MGAEQTEEGLYTFDGDALYDLENPSLYTGATEFAVSRSYHGAGRARDWMRENLPLDTAVTIETSRKGMRATAWNPRKEFTYQIEDVGDDPINECLATARLLLLLYAEDILLEEANG